MQWGGLLMKIFHTADWHLGKIVQGVYMTEDQRYVLEQFINQVKNEQPDVIIIAGDLYDRAVPPTEAIDLLNEVLEKLVLILNIPVLIVAGNHDSPGRLNFGSKIMKASGLHIVGEFQRDFQPVVLKDEFGEVHFHLVPYCDPSVVRTAYDDETIKTHDDAMKKIIDDIQKTKDPTARHIFVGHTFVTPRGEKRDNTSDSEIPLSIGGVEYVNHEYFKDFTYTALGHLHRAHKVGESHIRYAGSLLKYSISEEKHEKGYYIVELTGNEVSIQKQILKPRRDMYTVTGTLDEILRHPKKHDYVFIELTDRAPVLSPMERIRSVYPQAMHVKRKYMPELQQEESNQKKRREMTDVELFEMFYKEVVGHAADEELIKLFKEVMDEQLRIEREQ